LRIKIENYANVGDTGSLKYRFCSQKKNEEWKNANYSYRRGSATAFENHKDLI